jgi:hypothetical protein
VFLAAAACCITMNLDNDSSDDEFFGKQEEKGGEKLTHGVQNVSSKHYRVEGVMNAETNPESLSCRESKAQETIFRCVRGSTRLFLIPFYVPEFFHF